MIHPILAVEDVDRSIAFYTQQLDFKEDFCLEGPDGQSAFAFVSLGEQTDGNAIGLNREPLAGPAGQGVAFMIYLPAVLDIDDYYEAVRGRGVAIEAEIASQYWGDRSFSVKDPDGYYLSLSQPVESVDMDAIRATVRGDSD